MRRMTSLVYFICMLLFLTTSSYTASYQKFKEEGILSKNVTEVTPPNAQESQVVTEKSVPDSSAFGRKQLPLLNRVICIDPGHQSRMLRTKVSVAPMAEHRMPEYSIGTKGIVSQVFEYSITLKVALELEKGLKSLGAGTVLTRRRDDELVGNTKRAEIACEAGADISISLHCDGIEDEEIYGLSVLCPGDKYIKDQDLLTRSSTLSRVMLDHVTRTSKARNRGITKRNDLIVFNYSKVPCTLIEMGFLTNPMEEKLLNSPEYRSKLVKGIIDGILEYFNVSQKPGEETDIAGSKESHPEP